MRRGMAGYEAMGSEIGCSQQFATLAEVYGRAGEAEEGLALLTEARALMRRNGEHFFEAEIHRLRGELLLAQGVDEAEVECYYQQAIEVARQQAARSWELRAVTNLCRLWQRQGKRAQARHRLAEIYGWFSEGFDTADLREARALLDALS